MTNFFFHFFSFLKENILLKVFSFFSLIKRLPLGQEVKVMQCWRCKQYGHRTGDRDCPLYLSGNAKNEERNKFREDPMAYYISDKRKRQEDQHKEEKKEKKLKKHKKEKKKEKKEKKHKKSKKEKKRKHF